ncbi:MAG: hypothetical protein ACLVD8_26345 [Enterocloster sp.]|uniref:hypothetical protein n=1 Tax=Enterocloster sp. TaxID=2719315 RepID=UPI00399BCD50
MPCVMTILMAATRRYFLVYVPGGGDSSHSGLGQSTSIFGTTVKLELEETGNDRTLFSILSTAENAPNLKITLGGERIPLLCRYRGLQPHRLLYCAAV